MHFLENFVYLYDDLLAKVILSYFTIQIGIEKKPHFEVENPFIYKSYYRILR